MEKHSLQAGLDEESIRSTDVNRSGWRRQRSLSAVKRCLVLIQTAFGCWIVLRLFSWTGFHEGGVKWVSCGEGLGNEFQCTNISVPLDYRNSSDERTYQIAVVRLLASDEENRYAVLNLFLDLVLCVLSRKGAIFINPGGPGPNLVHFLLNCFRTYPDV